MKNENVDQNLLEIILNQLRTVRNPNDSWALTVPPKTAPQSQTRPHRQRPATRGTFGAFGAALGGPAVRRFRLTCRRMRSRGHTAECRMG